MTRRASQLTLWTIAFLAGAAALVYLIGRESDPAVEPYLDVSRAAEIKRASANMRPLNGARAGGTVSFVALEDRRGLQVSYSLRHVPAGVHGLHIHELGDCPEPGGSSFSRHFNPDASAHGLPGATVSHAGDLGNLVANETGWIQGSLTTARLSLDGGLDGVLQRAVVLTLRADDGATQPDGDSGPPVACGVISPG